jgi:hypothetical protein
MHIKIRAKLLQCLKFAQNLSKLKLEKPALVLINPAFEFATSVTYEANANAFALGRRRLELVKHE